MLTNEVHHITAVGKSSRNTSGEINPVWWIVGFCQSNEVVIVPVVGYRVPKYEETRYLWLSISTVLQS